MTALLIATRNAHKVREIQQFLTGQHQYLTLADFPSAPVAVEDGATFAANAIKKAAGLAEWVAGHSPLVVKKLTLPEAPFYVVADDSGLEVDALGGAPGVHSARFAALDVGGAGNSPDGANNAKLLRLMESIPVGKRGARFHCVLAARRLVFLSMTGRFLISPAQPVVLFEGVCEGHIGRRAAGRGGFGYDPLFVPKGFNQSFAELGAEAKNTLSHRAMALQKLRKHVEK